MRKFCAVQVLSSIALVMTVAGTTIRLGARRWRPRRRPLAAALAWSPRSGADDPAHGAPTGDGKISKDEWRGAGSGVHPARHE